VAGEPTLETRGARRPSLFADARFARSESDFNPILTPLCQVEGQIPMFKKLSRSRSSRRRTTHRTRRFETLERRNLLTFITQIGGDGNDYYRSQATDASGNTYIAGRFAGTSDFGGTTSYTSEYTTAFVAKYDPEGAYVWARVFDIQGEVKKGRPGTNDLRAQAMDIALGDDGDVYVAGSFRDEIDLAGNGTYDSSAGLGDMFIAKLDGDDGSTKWAETIGGAGSDGASAIAFSNGFLYVTGSFEETIDFDPGDEPNETYPLTSPGSSDSASKFFLVLQPVIPDNPQDPEDVSFVTAWKIDGTTSQWFSSELFVDGNQLFVAGRFRGTVDFNPSSDVGYPSSYYDHFVASYTTSGSFNWVQFPGEPAADHYHLDIDIALDGADGLYVASAYGVGGILNKELTLAKYGRDDGQLDPNFTPKHFDRISSDASLGIRGLIVDSTGDDELYLGVRYSGTIDLDPGPNVISPPTASYESAILKLDGSGNYLNHWHSGGQDATPTAVVSNTLYVVGFFGGTKTFPENNELTSAGGDDIYLLGLDVGPPPAPSFSVNDVEVIEGDVGTVIAEFTVSRSGDSSVEVSVDVSTSNGTATIANGDYVAVGTTTLVFGPGVTSLPVSVTVNGDVVEEGNETFFLNLANATGGATIARCSRGRHHCRVTTVWFPPFTSPIWTAQRVPAHEANGTRP